MRSTTSFLYCYCGKFSSVSCPDDGIKFPETLAMSESIFLNHFRTKTHPHSKIKINWNAQFSRKIYFLTFSIFCAFLNLYLKHNKFFFQRKELSELQEQLNRRVQALCERQRSVELLDKKIIDLVEEQKSLSKDYKDDLQNLRTELAERSEEDLKKIEQKKQGYE